MKILIDIDDQAWMSNQALADQIAGSVKWNQICLYPELGEVSEIGMLACDRLRPGLARKLPNLQLVQKLGAGVDSMVFDPDLGNEVRIARLKPQQTALEMARYSLAWILADMHHLDRYRGQQVRREWNPVEPLEAETKRVGVLGLGHIGGEIARLCCHAGLNVSGWSRSPKSLEGVECESGPDGLVEVLKKADYLVSVLPSTHDTREMFNQDRFRLMKSGAVFINVGRGSLVAEHDLIEALDSGRPGRAILDVFQREPLPPGNPLWKHPAVTITPHVSGWHLEQGLSVVADNFHRLVQNQPLLNETDRKLGY